ARPARRPATIAAGTEGWPGPAVATAGRSRHSHWPLAPPATALVTPACCAGVSCAHLVPKLPGPTAPSTCSVFRYDSTSTCASPCLPSIQTLAAWQAWPYWDSVASEGTSTLVVTPP